MSFEFRSSFSTRTMTDYSKLILRQSTTTIASTPPQSSSINNKLVHAPAKRLWTPHVPSFLELFVIRRVLCEYFLHNCSILSSSNIKVINEFVGELDIEQQQEQQANEILLQLYNNGINKYMKQHYNQDNETLLIAIDTVYDQIIKGKHNTIYEKLISYRYDHDVDNDNKNKVYQNLVFNTSDLMYSIFQWFGIGYNNNNVHYIYGYDLHCCSLVNFHWLFHVLHPNSVYFVNLTRYHHTHRIKPDATKAWQRFTNVKSVQIAASFLDLSKSFEGILDRVALCNKVSKIVGYGVVSKYHKSLITMVTTILEHQKIRSNIMISTSIHETHID